MHTEDVDSYIDAGASTIEAAQTIGGVYQPGRWSKWPFFRGAWHTKSQEVTTEDQRSHATVTFLPAGRPKPAPGCIMGKGHRFVPVAVCVCATCFIFMVE